MPRWSIDLILATVDFYPCEGRAWRVNISTPWGWGAFSTASAGARACGAPRFWTTWKSSTP